MMNKNAKLLLGVSLVLCCGCVDNTYDLNKDIVMDVAITGNKITLPIGNVKPIVLDSLIDVDDIDLLERMNGVYGLKKTDIIDPINIDIDPIKINIDPINHSTTFQFDNVTIEEAVLNEIVKEQEFSVNEVTIEDLNQSLPTLNSKVEKELYTAEMQSQIESLKNTGSTEVFTVNVKDETFETDVEHVDFKFDYELPKEIKNITDITLNNLVQFEVFNPDCLEGAAKTISFTVTFPEDFILRLYDESDKRYSLSPDKHTVTATGINAETGTTLLQFYIDEMNGLRDKNINGKLSFDNVIKYRVTYVVNGDIPISANTNLDEFKFLVTMNHKVAFEDAKGSTNDIDVEFEQMDFDFSAHFDNLEHIDSVKYINFDASRSKINFTTDLGDEGGFAPFNLKQGSLLKLSFPKTFFLDLNQCVYPLGTEYDEDEHAFYISDINVLHNFQWELAIHHINVDKKVENHKCDLDAVASISVVAEDEMLKLGETAVESFNSTLQRLESKFVTFTMGETHLHIDDAVVKTEVIHEEIEEHASFSVNEKIDDGVKTIQSIDFYEPIPIIMDVDMTGVEELQTTVHLNLDVELPSFLVLTSNDSRVKIENGKMTIKADYIPQGGKMEIELFAQRIQFTGEEFPNGMELKDSTDNNRYLQYERDVPIGGEAYIDETEMHSTILGKDIGIDVNFNIAEIEVKKFSGIYGGEIDDVHETIDFDLGESLDFLKGDGNTVTLSDPQIKFTIDNPVSVPVDMQLSIFGKDDNGKVIEESRVEATIRLEPAAFEEVTDENTGQTTIEVNTREMKYLLTSKETLLEGYTNVVIPNLGNLLKKIPNSLNIDLIPTIDESSTHYVDLSKELVLHPTYDVVVPLIFDNLHIEYTELVEDLNEDLYDALEYFTNIKLKVDMNIRNTVPAQMVLTVEPLDSNGNLIEGIEIEDILISAGNGEDVNKTSDENKGENLQIVIKSNDDAFRKLDKLNILVKGDVNETVAGVALSPEQGVHITNVVLEITGDVETNLDEL